MQIELSSEDIRRIYQALSEANYSNLYYRVMQNASVAVKADEKQHFIRLEEMFKGLKNER